MNSRRFHSLASSKISPRWHAPSNHTAAPMNSLPPLRTPPDAAAQSPALDDAPACPARRAASGRNDLVRRASAARRGHRVPPDHVSLAVGKKFPRRAVRAGETWGRLYDQRWCRVHNPQPGGPRWMRWDEQGEATLFIERRALLRLRRRPSHLSNSLPACAKSGWSRSACKPPSGIPTRRVSTKKEISSAARRSCAATTPPGPPITI